MGVRGWAKGIGTGALRARAGRRAAAAAAASRGRSLVLLYHRVGPRAADHEVVPTVPTGLFRDQLEALAEIGDIVPLDDLLVGPSRGRRPRFAVTFDDDYRGAAEHALPVLQDSGAPATFFLSGRCLHDAGPYWWMQLESEIAADGVAAVARRLGVAASTPAQLAAACEGTDLVGRLVPLAVEQADLLDAHGIRALAAAGMDIGFHTIEHPVLTRLDDAAVDHALGAGRDALEDVVGRSIDLFAYPHGRADGRVATRAAAAGYRAAFTTAARPLTSRSHRFLAGRWEPGSLPAERLQAEAVARLWLPGRGPRPRAGAASAA